MGAAICKEFCGREKHCGDALDVPGFVTPCRAAPRTTADVWRATETYEESQRVMSGLAVPNSPGGTSMGSACDAIWKPVENKQMADPDGEKTPEKSVSTPVAEALSLEAVIPDGHLPEGPATLAPQVAGIAPEPVAQAATTEKECQPLPSGVASGTEALSATPVCQRVAASLAMAI
eukprot:CAMPEP_0170594444 /NCGR_PEP_ID=MMETSP0224-20130122/14006_1 /TAXON_ID=285029 /ORGANISM="Togula jolla, Strain CCCM 725" /LENGTH=175 /DNA_ID=CAMNT_0010918507 /DNA_START=45 /DNA_END=573 /DNA_ORIENTATION=+